MVAVEKDMMGTTLMALLVGVEIWDTLKLGYLGYDIAIYTVLTDFH